MKKTSEGLRRQMTICGKRDISPKADFTPQLVFTPSRPEKKRLKQCTSIEGARAAVGHSIRKLIELLEPRVSALDALIGAARELDLMYIPSRYPNGLDEGTPGEAFGPERSKRAINLAQSILAAVTAGMR